MAHLEVTFLRFAFLTCTCILALIGLLLSVMSLAVAFLFFSALGARGCTRMEALCAFATFCECIPLGAICCFLALCVCVNRYRKRISRLDCITTEHRASSGLPAGGLRMFR